MSAGPAKLRRHAGPCYTRAGSCGRSRLLVDAIDSMEQIPPQTGTAVHASTNGSTVRATQARRRMTRGGPLGTARLAVALAAGKLTAKTGRVLRVGGGTSLPGIVARRIDPGVLRKVIGGSRARKIVVCGSNGKTTTGRMLAALAQASGKSVTQNRTGSNLLQSVTAVAVNGAGLLRTLG